MNKCLHTELSSHERTRGEFNPRTVAIKLGIDVYQEFYVVVCQEGGATPSWRSASRKEAFLSWPAKSKQKGSPVPPPIALIKLLLRLRPHAPRRLSGLEHKPNAPKEEEPLQD
jgi:hypothetical protein